MYDIECDGEEICMTGDFMCECCSYQLKGIKKFKKPIIKKPRLENTPPKQFKRRKK